MATTISKPDFNSIINYIQQHINDNNTGDIAPNELRKSLLDLVQALEQTWDKFISNPTALDLSNYLVNDGSVTLDPLYDPMDADGLVSKSWVEQTIANLAASGIDLTNYYTKAQTDAKFILATALSSYYTKAETDTKISDGLATVPSNQSLTDAITAALLGYYTKQQTLDLLANYPNVSQVRSEISSYLLQDRSIPARLHTPHELVASDITLTKSAYEGKLIVADAACSLAIPDAQSWSIDTEIGIFAYKGDVTLTPSGLTKINNSATPFVVLIGGYTTLKYLSNNNWIRF